MAGECPLTCYSFIKHCLSMPERRGEHVTHVMNDQRVTSSLLTTNTGRHRNTQNRTSLKAKPGMYANQYLDALGHAITCSWQRSFSEVLYSPPLIHNSFDIIFYLITDPPLKSLFFASSHQSHNAVTKKAEAIKDTFNYVSKQSMKDQHQKRFLLTLAEPESRLDNGEQLER